MCQRERSIFPSRSAVSRFVLPSFLSQQKGVKWRHRVAVALRLCTTPLWMVSASRLPNGNRYKKCNLPRRDVEGKLAKKRRGAFLLRSTRPLPCSIEGKEEEGDTPRRLCLGCRFDFLRKLQLFSRSICAPIRQSRPLSVRPTDRPTVVRGREWSTMHNGPKPHSYFYGQNISGSERRRGNERSLTTLFKT